MSAVRKLSLETKTNKTEKKSQINAFTTGIVLIWGQARGGGYVHAVSDTVLISVHTRIAIFRVIVRWLQGHWNNSIYNSFTQKNITHHT